MQHEPEVKRWTAKRKAELVKEIIKGKTTVKEARIATPQRHGRAVTKIRQNRVLCDRRY